LKLALETRKSDITIRKAMSKKARENRENLIAQSQERDENRAKMIEDAKEAFDNEHAADFEAYNAYVQKQKDLAEQEYASEEEDEDAEKAEPPVEPKFEEAEHFDKFDEENPPIEIPAEVAVEVDNDWPMNEEEEEALIAQFWAAKEQ